MKPHKEFIEDVKEASSLPAQTCRALAPESQEDFAVYTEGVKDGKKQTAMEEREKATNQKWIDKGDGYFTLQAQFFATVIYVAIPKENKCCGKGYDDFMDLEVNGGLTFANENVFGWDYGHAYNKFDFEGDIKRAIEYFKSKHDALMEKSE